VNPARYSVRRLIRAGRHLEPLYIFRILADVSVEIFDVGAHAWRPRPLEPLYRWAVIEPEMGVDEISADEAAALIHQIECGRTAGRRREPDAA
jgi:hypothetical protein